MFITTLTITDYKRVRKVAIKPDADRHLILIGGRNRQGKSSTLDAITAAFGGAKAIAADPVRHGASEAAIYVELDGGRLTIDRTITDDGKTQLEVRDAEGPVRMSPWGEVRLPTLTMTCVITPYFTRAVEQQFFEIHQSAFM